MLYVNEIANFKTCYFISKPKKIAKFEERQWLNQEGHHSFASILAKGETDRYEIQIADCENKIRLVEYLTSKTNIVNGLHKIDTLLNTLQNLRNFIVTEHQTSKKLFSGVVSFMSLPQAHQWVKENAWKLCKPLNTNHLEEYSKEEKGILYHAVLEHKPKNKKLKYTIRYEG